MLVELSPILLATLERVNELSAKLVLEDDKNEADRLRGEYSRERRDFLTLMNDAVQAVNVSREPAKLDT
ncbi:hypothetical protein [Pseudomonas sp. EL_65y_Pfl1_R32]|uniref:hypothetical protein n=1 Tax=Pseudomonas sp. EL_65y_Pfl1_R32 TaxID=3088696 RepID=UPI0030DA66AA